MQSPTSISGLICRRPAPTTFAQEGRHATESYSIEKRQAATAIPGRRSNGRTFAPCGCRIGRGGLLVSRDWSRPGIFVVPVAGRLPLLLLQDAAAMSVDGIRHRRLRL